MSSTGYRINVPNPFVFRMLLMASALMIILTPSQSSETVPGRETVAASSYAVHPAFVCDHIETLCEIGITCAALTRERGNVNFLRAPSLNTSPLFIDCLADLVAREARIR